MDIDQSIKRMSLQEKVGQVMAVGFDGITPDPELIEMVERFHLGGVILFARNVESPEQVLNLTNQLQQSAHASGHIGLMVAIDQEGGRVARLTEDKGFTEFPSAMAVAATGDSKYAFLMAKAMAAEMKAVGINVDYAPVLDVNNNPLNPIISHRSFGSDPDRVAEFGISFTKGLLEEGIMPFGKHFPGHGDTTIDSHLGLPEIAHDRARLEKIEFKPFRAAIRAGLPGIMTTHITFPAIEPDGLPATLSPRILTDLLREEMGFEGLLVTDSLEMGALAENGYPPALAAAMALRAGADQLLFNHGHAMHKEVIAKVMEWVMDGKIPHTRLDSAVRRVLVAKVRLGILEGGSPKQEIEIGKPGWVEHRALSRMIAAKAVSLVKDEAGLLPVDPSSAMIIETPLGRGLGEFSDIPAIQVPDQPTSVDIHFCLDASRGKKSVILAVADIHQNADQALLVRTLAGSQIPLILASLRSPYDILSVPEIKTCLVTFGSQPSSLEALANVLKGVNPLMGKPPIVI